MKYTDARVTFAEVPDEIALCVNISNCPCHCKGCHSAYLAEDVGKPLDWGSLNALIYINAGISCVAFMGGDASPRDVDRLAYHVKKAGLKTCWYSGRDTLSGDIQLSNFDYIKTGGYREEYGPLNKRSTNQRFYRVENGGLVDETWKFWKLDGDEAIETI